MHEVASRQMRQFHRAVVEWAGVVDDVSSAQGRPLAPARVLWEVGTLGDDGCELRTLRTRLDLGPGYLRHVLHALAADGLVTISPAAGDQRSRQVKLTVSGRRERLESHARSRAAAASSLQPLHASQQRRLLEAMAEVERLLTAAAIAVRPSDPSHPDARDCLREYFAELSERDDRFDPTTSRPAAEDELRCRRDCCS